MLILVLAEMGQTRPKITYYQMLKCLKKNLADSGGGKQTLVAFNLICNRLTAKTCERGRDARRQRGHQGWGRIVGCRSRLEPPSPLAVTAGGLPLPHRTSSPASLTKIDREPPPHSAGERSVGVPRRGPSAGALRFYRGRNVDRTDQPSHRPIREIA
nr:hypothetical protein Itr_chr14CG07160 [Ipomoea trifida]GMD89711.1 hypothetical protein Iba_chr14dCG2680 [Ipomoea batatas]GME06636.1 hypothetical protein Iba_scaffold4858CG0040 [Ipomoea batatas]GME06637.1 hypothetical protein Iba_scaffold4858CG0050 [Ipomoea batatas]